MRIECVGDSLTEGVIKPPYPEQLQAMLLEEGYDSVKVSNRGKSGFTVGHYLDWITQPEPLAALKKRSPDVVLLCIGGNDTRSTQQTPTDVYQQRFAELVDVYHTLESEEGTSPLVLVGLVPRYYGPIRIKWQGEVHLFDAADRIEQELNPAIETVANERGIEVVDLYTPLLEAGRIVFPDSLHPNAKGNRILAETWLGALFPVLDRFL